MWSLGCLIFMLLTGGFEPFWRPGRPVRRRFCPRERSVGCETWGPADCRGRSKASMAPGPSIPPETAGNAQREPSVGYGNNEELARQETMAEGSHRASSPPKTCEVCRCQHRQEGNSGAEDKRQKTKDKRQKTKDKRQKT